MLIQHFYGILTFMKKAKNENKTIILDVAQQLFYENGINNTSYETIAKECGITKPMISYYFDSKAHLAGTIFGKYSREMSDYFTEKVYQSVSGYAVLDINAAFSIMQAHYYKTEQKAFRFYIEFFDSSFVDVTEGVEDFYKMTARQLGLKISYQRLHMLYIGSNYAARGLIYHYANGDIQCSQDEFEQYYMRNSYYMYGLNDQQIGQLLTNAKEILSKVPFEFLPNFKLK